MAEKKRPKPTKGSYARDRSNRSNTTGGSITRRLWNFVTDSEEGNKCTEQKTKATE